MFWLVGCWGFYVVFFVVFFCCYFGLFWVFHFVGWGLGCFVLTLWSGDMISNFCLAGGGRDTPLPS